MLMSLVKTRLYRGGGCSLMQSSSPDFLVSQNIFFAFLNLQIVFVSLWQQLIQIALEL